MYVIRGIANKMDRFRQVVKRLEQTNDDVNFALMRDYKPIPLVESVRDEFDWEMPFVMDFDNPNPTRSVELNLFFKPPANSPCSQGCFAGFCEVFESETVLDTVYDFLPDTVRVYINEIPTESFNITGSNQVTLTVTPTEGEQIVVAYVYRKTSCVGGFTRYTSQNVGQNSYFYVHNNWVIGPSNSQPDSLPAEQESWGTLNGEILISSLISGTNPAGFAAVSWLPHELNHGVLHRSFYENVTQFDRGIYPSLVNGYDEFVTYMRFPLPDGSYEGRLSFDQVFAISMAIGTPTDQYDFASVDIRYAFSAPGTPIISGHRPFEWGTSLGSLSVEVQEPFDSPPDESADNVPREYRFPIPSDAAEIYLWFVQFRNPLGYEHVESAAVTQGGAQIWTIVDADRARIGTTPLIRSRELFYLDIYWNRG